MEYLSDFSLPSVLPPTYNTIAITHFFLDFYFTRLYVWTEELSLCELFMVNTTSVSVGFEPVTTRSTTKLLVKNGILTMEIYS